MERVSGCLASNPPRTLFVGSWYVLGIGFLYIYAALDTGGHFPDRDAARQWNRLLGDLSDPERIICIDSESGTSYTTAQKGSGNGVCMCTNWNLNSGKSKHTILTYLSRENLCPNKSKVCDQKDISNITVEITIPPVVECNKTGECKPVPVCMVVTDASSSKPSSLLKKIRETRPTPDYQPCCSSKSECLANSKVSPQNHNATRTKDSCTNGTLTLLSLRPKTLHKGDPLPYVNANADLIHRSKMRSLLAGVSCFCVGIVLSILAVIQHKPGSVASRKDDEAEETLVDGKAS